MNSQKRRMLERCVMSSEMYDEFKDRFQLERDVFPFVVTSAGGAGVALSEFILNNRDILESVELPLKIELRAVFDEPHPVDSWQYTNAENRIWGLFADPPISQVANGEVFHGEPGCFKSERLDNYFAALRKWCERKGVPYTDECPYTDDGSSLSSAAIKLLGRRSPPFRGILSNPFWRYHPRFARVACGEISSIDRTRTVEMTVGQNKVKRHPSVLRELGFLFGIHLGIPGGGLAALARMGGAKMMVPLLQGRFQKAQWMLTGIGPELDAYWHADGNVRSLKMSERFPEWAGNIDSGYPRGNLDQWSAKDQGDLAWEIHETAIKWIGPMLKKVFASVFVNRMHALVGHWRNCDDDSPADVKQGGFDA